MEKYVIFFWVCLVASLLLAVLVGRVVKMWRKAKKEQADIKRLKAGSVWRQRPRTFLNDPFVEDDRFHVTVQETRVNSDVRMWVKYLHKSGLEDTAPADVFVQMFIYIEGQDLVIKADEVQRMARGMERIAKQEKKRQQKHLRMDKFGNWENGDVLVNALTGQPFLFWKMEGGKIYTHCGIDSNGRFCLGHEDWSNPKGCRLATLEEKKRLMVEMKKRGLVFAPESGYVDIIHKDAICYTALEHYGPHHQIVKCMEECGELIQALARSLSGEHNGENVAEELADVEIMLMQMRIAFGRQKTRRVMAQKLARLKMRMEEEEA